MESIEKVSVFQKERNVSLDALRGIVMLWIVLSLVSYTHLDVYKRQGKYASGSGSNGETVNHI